MKKDKKLKTGENQPAKIKINKKKLEQLKTNQIKTEELNNDNKLMFKNNQSKCDDLKENHFEKNENIKATENASSIATAQSSKSKEKSKPLTKKQEWINLLKFVLFSVSAGVIQIVSFTLLSELIFHDADNEYGISYFISLVLSVVWNFTFNRKFTFKSAKNVPLAMLLVFIYYCAFTPLSIWWGIALTDFAGWNSYLVLAMTMVINFLTEYLWTRFVVYRDNINTATPKEKKNKTKKEPKHKKEKPEKIKKEKVKKDKKEKHKTEKVEDLKPENNINQGEKKNEKNN